jgi:hypothetical protein
MSNNNADIFLQTNKETGQKHDNEPNKVHVTHHIRMFQNVMFENNTKKHQ